MWARFNLYHNWAFLSLALPPVIFSAVMSSLIPEKLMREWKELLFIGLPLYEPIKGQQPGFGISAPLVPIELKKQEILNNQDYDEYTVSLKHECSVFLNDIGMCVFAHTLACNLSLQTE